MARRPEEYTYAIIHNGAIPVMLEEVAGDSGETKTIAVTEPVMKPILDEEGNETGEYITRYRPVYDENGNPVTEVVQDNSGGYALIWEEGDYSMVIIRTPEGANVRSALRTAALSTELGTTYKYHEIAKQELPDGEGFNKDSLAIQNHQQSARYMSELLDYTVTTPDTGSGAELVREMARAFRPGFAFGDVGI